MTYKTLFLFASAALLSACSSSANLMRQQQVALTQEMLESKQVYKACLADHPDRPSVCDVQRSAYEADVKSVSAVTTSSTNVNGFK
jgi:uncharacterized lipoprotein